MIGTLGDMTIKRRSPGKTAISVSLNDDLLAAVDARAELLGLNRSQYFVALARNDLQTRGGLVLSEQPGLMSAKPEPPKPAPKITTKEKALIERARAVSPQDHGPKTK